MTEQYLDDCVLPRVQAGGRDVAVGVSYERGKGDQVS